VSAFGFSDARRHVLFKSTSTKGTRCFIKTSPTPRQSSYNDASSESWLLRLGLNAAISLLGNTQFDTLASRQRHPRLVAFANDEHVVQPTFTQETTSISVAQRKTTTQLAITFHMLILRDICLHCFDTVG